MSISQTAAQPPHTARTVAMAAAATVTLVLAVGITWYYTRQEGYVAKVNGEPIPVSEFQPIVERQKTQYVQRMNMNFRTPQGQHILTNIEKNTIQHLVEEHLLLQEAQKRGVSASQADVDAKLKEILNRNFGGNQAMMDKAMKDSGLTLNDVKDMTRKNLMIEKTIKAIAATSDISDAEMKAYYDKHIDQFKRPEEVKASHILVKTEAEAKDILAKLRGGADFAALAKQYSQDPGSKNNGGDLGYFSRGRMVPAFEKAAYSLKQGELSSPVKTQYGYHIIKVTDHHGAQTMPFDAVKPQLKMKLMQEAQQKKFTDWFESAKKSAKVVIAPQYNQPEATPPPAAINPQGGPPAVATVVPPSGAASAAPSAAAAGAPSPAASASAP